MDGLVQKSLREVQSKARSSVPWKLDQPWKQSTHSYRDGAWKAELQVEEDESITCVAVYSWNIDFMLPFADSRMSKAVEYLQDLMNGTTERESTASIVYLQECLHSDIKFLAARPWIRETFAMTDVDISNWQSGHYGTVTLVDRRVPVVSCFRLHYSETTMERDVLVTDIAINQRIIRMCNTHLESLALEPPRRIPQTYMHEPSLAGAIAAGDFNAIQEFDRTLHSSNELKDAYLELGGSEDDAAGHTWGQQAATKLRKQFGTSRMDKVYFRGDIGLQSFEKFGANVMVDDEAEREQIVQLGFDRPWATDHLGVKAKFSVPGPRPAL